MFIGLKSYILNNMLKKPKVVILALCPSVESMLIIDYPCDFLWVVTVCLSLFPPLWSVGLYLCRLLDRVGERRERREPVSFVLR